MSLILFDILFVILVHRAVTLTSCQFSGVFAAGWSEQLEVPAICFFFAVPKRVVINSDQAADDTPSQTKGTFYMTVLLSLCEEGHTGKHQQTCSCSFKLNCSPPALGTPPM